MAARHFPAKPYSGHRRCPTTDAGVRIRERWWGRRVRGNARTLSLGLLAVVVYAAAAAAADAAVAVAATVIATRRAAPVILPRIVKHA